MPARPCFLRRSFTPLRAPWPASGDEAALTALFQDPVAFGGAGGLNDRRLAESMAWD